MILTHEQRIAWRDACREDGPAGFPFMAQIVPAGQHGTAKVKHQTITDNGGIHAQLHGYGTTNGTYAILTVGGQVFMSDTDMERRSNSGVAAYAEGDVLIGGLGLGMIVCPLLRKPTVRTITVVELNPDVIALVEPAIRAWGQAKLGLERVREALTVVQGDVYTWKPAKGQKFDAIYWDIWPDICEDNLAGIAKLHQRGKAWKRSRESFMDSWQRAKLLMQRRDDRRRNPWGY